MPTATAQPQEISQFQVADENERKMRQVVKGIESKTEHGATVIEGYVATQGVDRAGDMFTEDALQEMADQINNEMEADNASVDLVFPEFDAEDLKEIKQNYSANGNVDHYNNPGFPMGDPRIVSAYRIVGAEYDGFGVKIKAELKEDLPFNVPEAIKTGLQEGYLDGFSVEFVAKKARRVMENGQRVRKIMSAKFTGAALTGRPLQSAASVTDAEFKSMVGELIERQSSKAEVPDNLEEELGEDRFIPPEGAADNARKALNWKDEKDAPGGEQQGTDTARMIVDAVENDEPLSTEMISEIASFDRHRQQGNHTIDEEFEGEPWMDAGYVAWLLWGGDVGVDWAQDLNNRIDEIESKTDTMVNQEVKVDYAFSAGDTVSWNDTSGTVRDRTKDSCFNSEIDGDVEVCGTEEDPAYLIEVDNDEGTMVGHKQSLFTEDQESKAQHYESNAAHLKEEMESKQMSIPLPSQVQLLYPTREAAAQAGEVIGITGVHSHMLDGEEFFMPGETHEDFIQSVNSVDGGVKAEQMEEMERKASVAGVTFEGTREGDLDESEIPNDGFEDHYLAPGDNKSDSSFPVVDGEGFLRRGNVEAAYNLRGQGDDISKDELEDRLLQLNEEFDNPPIEPENSQESKSFINRSEELEAEVSAWQELKNNITGDTMPEENETQDEEPEEEQNQEENVEEQESKSAAEELKEELEEVRQEMKSLVKENEELREEKEEIEQKFDDLEGLQEVKSDVDDLKQELKSVTPENAPQQDTEQNRADQVKEQESKSALEQQLESYSNPNRMIQDQDMKSAIAERHGVTEEKVEETAQELAA